MGDPLNLMDPPIVVRTFLQASLVISFVISFPDAQIKLANQRMEHLVARAEPTLDGVCLIRRALMNVFSAATLWA